MLKLLAGGSWRFVARIERLLQIRGFDELTTQSQQMSNQSDELGHDEGKVFVSDQTGPGDYTGFFEDDGETGYLYISHRKKNEIVQQLQIYINSAQLKVDEKDVRVVWSTDGKKCGVLIWGGMRGIIDLAKNREGRAFVESRSTPPIDDREWLEGFE